ncbi:MAG: OadG family protein [Oscillospiraceae bacterium]|nr:OadG family protein [Oscillospiraceae bacterium]
MNPVFVVLMGVGTVFFGLICIIILSTAMSAVCRAMGGTPAPVAAAPAAPAAVSAAIPNRQAMIAAISAAIAEDLGTDLTGIRVLSVKKL